MKLTPLQANSPGTPSTPSLRAATITGRADDWFFVQEPKAARLRRASSCLTEPQLGDLVLICDFGSDEIGYITAVLQSACVDACSVHLPGGVKLTAANNALTVDADQIALKGNHSIRLQTAHVEMDAAAATMRVSHWKVWSESIETHAARATLAVTLLSSQIGSAISRMRNSWRKVEELDELHTGRSRTVVDGQYKVNAEHFTVHTTGFVRIDGKKIDLG